MQVLQLRLQNFRNYAQQEVELGPGLHVFQGSNAQGKTALLEAIYLAATARSFRTHRELDLIRWQQAQARVELLLQRDSGKRRGLRLDWERVENRCQRQIFLDQNPIHKLAEFLRELPLALFTPEDLQLVQAGPEERRRYLDLLLCKLYPAYLEALGRYQKVLRHKTALLKAQVSGAELESWNELLVGLGCQLTNSRHEICQQLAEHVPQMYQQLAQEDELLEVDYRPSGAAEPEAFRRLLVARLSEELRLRSCLVGPHRDELEFQLKGGSLRRFGSQGQQRTLALALRLSQADLLHAIGGERPVVLLDDCFSELDPGRQQRLLHWLQQAPQVLITTATGLDLPCDYRHYRVDEGQVMAWR
jgi:DNA replication and repair protein RecF